MRDRHVVRGLVALPVLAALGVFLAWGYSGLPRFGDFHGFYGQLINAIALRQRHTTNAVTAVVFDYRGFDTMGEEFILFAAVVGVVLLLRETGTRPARDPVRSDAIKLFGVLALGGVVLIGLWLAAYGLVTPGGGFQGGVAVASAVVVLYLTVGYGPWHTLTTQEALDPLEASGAATYVIVGLAALIGGAPFLHNLLGPGIPGTLWSGGSLGIINWGVALEVAAANVVLYTEFLQSFVAPLGTGRL